MKTPLNMIELHNHQKQHFLHKLDIPALKRRLETLKNCKMKTLSIKKEINSIQEKIQCEEMKIKNENIYHYNTHNILEKYLEFELNVINKKKIDINNFFNNKTSKSNVSKKNLLNDYHFITNNVMPENFENKLIVCGECDVEMSISKNNDFYVCVYCGYIKNIIVDTDISNCSMTDTYSKSSIYQRKNHFREWLNQIQAKETVDIPGDIMDRIRNEINNMNITDLKLINVITIKKVLKKLNLNKYYENAHYIIYSVNGVRPPVLSNQKEKELLFYFKQIEEPFYMFKKKNRKNILRYSYILHKLCELMELDEFLPHFNLLKNREKLVEQDNTWKAICNYLQWEFIPSI